LRPEKAYRRRVRDAAGTLARQPALPLAWIVVGQQRRRTSAPPSAESNTQLHPHARVTRNVPDVPSFRSVLGYDPKLPANTTVTYRSATRLSGLATYGLQERVPRRGNSQGK